MLQLMPPYYIKCILADLTNLCNVACYSAGVCRTLHHHLQHRHRHRHPRGHQLHQLRCHQHICNQPCRRCLSCNPHQLAIAANATCSTNADHLTGSVHIFGRVIRAGLATAGAGCPPGSTHIIAPTSIAGRTAGLSPAAAVAYATTVVHTGARRTAARLVALFNTSNTNVRPTAATTCDTCPAPAAAATIALFTPNSVALAGCHSSSPTTTVAASGTPSTAAIAGAITQCARRGMAAHFASSGANSRRSRP